MENAKDGFPRHLLQEQNFKDLKGFCFVLIFQLLTNSNIFYGRTFSYLKVYRGYILLASLAQDIFPSQQVPRNR